VQVRTEASVETKDRSSPSKLGSTRPDEYDVLLRDGGIAHLRPLRPDDGKALHDLVDRSSERSAHPRFFAGGTATPLTAPTAPT
jgi:hypothetical protein